MATSQVPTWLGQIAVAVVIAAGGGAVGTVVTLAVLQSQVENLATLVTRLDKRVDKMEDADNEQKARLRELERRQAVDEVLRPNRPATGLP